MKHSGQTFRRVRPSGESNNDDLVSLVVCTCELVSYLSIDELSIDPTVQTLAPVMPERVLRGRASDVDSQIGTKRLVQKRRYATTKRISSGVRPNSS